jgi:hypothetical protein
MVRDYDSDGVPINHESHSDNLDRSYVDSLSNVDSSPCSSVLASSTMPEINDGQLLSKFKSVMNCHKSQASKRKLWEILTNTEHNQKIKLLRDQPSLLGGSQEEFVSLHLALDTATESVYIPGHPE